jgi:site-specific DNA-methyltransferase (adenine-specific)
MCEASTRVITGDCVEEMKAMASEGKSFDLIFADPPFNISYPYDVYRDWLPRKEYLDWTEEWMKAARGLLSSRGSLWVAAPDEYVHRFRVMLEDDIGLHFRHHVVWHYSFGVNSAKKLTRSHAHLLHYTLDRKKFCWNGDAIKVPSWRQLNGDKRAKPGGKHPDDTWNYNRVCGTHKEREGWHTCQMPLAILDRIVRVSSDPGDLVLDPFLGSGTTGVAAIKLGRRFVGVELSEDYAAKAAVRLSKAKPTIEV